MPIMINTKSPNLIRPFLHDPIPNPTPRLNIKQTSSPSKKHPLPPTHHPPPSPMAKTPKLKTPSKPSTHSRASRRASSPSLAANLEKSPTNAPKPTTKKPHILAPQPGAGISKPSKKKSGKILKRKQKLRLEHGKEKAEAVNGKLERKVERAEEMREGKKGRNVRDPSPLPYTC